MAFDNSDSGNHVSGLVAQALSSINIPCSRLLLPKNQDIGEFAKNSDDRQASLSALVQGAVSFNQSYENLIGKT